ncbi:MAG: glucuronate isomerase [Devosia sp.]
MLNDDRFFPADPTTRDIARNLFKSIRKLPLISPHGHTEPRWYAENLPFPDPAQLLIVPDHYVNRMLVSQGVDLSQLGVMRKDGGDIETDGRTIWRLFAKHYYLFRGTPSRSWLDTTFQDLFGLEPPLTPLTADLYYDTIAECLGKPEFLPRAMFERFNLEMIATTDGAIDDLKWHKMIRESGWAGRVVPTYRPDTIVDPDKPSFHADLDILSVITDCDTGTWWGYLDAHRKRRAFFISMGATASDHGHPSALAADLSKTEAIDLFAKVRTGEADAAERELFRAQMLTELAQMSVEDGLVMQIHPGARRNHSPSMFAAYGTDKGFDIPGPTDYVSALKPLLDRFGMEKDLRIILFTLDETSYARELAPLAGVYPALRLGPPWWFFDSPEGMLRFREQATETAGFYNTVGFNDDTRAFPSIPARHDVARRIDCAYLARLVAEHRLREDEAYEVASDLAYNLPKLAYKL